MRKQAAKTRMIHARIEPKLQESAARVFSRIGISTAEAVRLFLKQVELHQGLPFPITIPNAQTVAAMMDAPHQPSITSSTAWSNTSTSNGLATNLALGGMSLGAGKVCSDVITTPTWGHFTWTAHASSSR